MRNDYQKELTLLLSHECLARICAGTAEFVADNVNIDKAVYSVTNALGQMYTENKRWSELISLFGLSLDRAIEKNSPLDKTTGWERGLGDALESKGFYEHAALICAEAGRHMHRAKHPKTSDVMNEAGLAWRRHGD